MNALLEYDAPAVAAGELWRIITCHFVHWTPSHFAWDFSAFVLLLIAAWRAGIPARHVALAIAIAAVAIPLGLTGIVRYRGLSGIDSALFTLVAFHRRANPVAMLALLGFLLKLGSEIATGTVLFVLNLGPGVVAVPIAHVIGGLVGLGAATLLRHQERGLHAVSSEGGLVWRGTENPPASTSNRPCAARNGER